MRIAFAGDWHANTFWALRAIEHARAKTAEAIVHLGDYGYDFEPEFISLIEFALAEADIELWFVDGNHENFTWLYQQPVQEDGRRKISEHVYHLPRGFRWEWNGTTFLALGGAHSVDRRWRKLGKSWWIEEIISDEDVEKCIAGGPVDILIAHDCPDGVEIPGLAGGAWQWPSEVLYHANEHRKQVRRVVNATRPREVWHGHYHRRYDALANFGWGQVEVHGLDMDATNLSDNVVIVDLPDR